MILIFIKDEVILKKKDSMCLIVIGKILYIILEYWFIVYIY